VSPLIVLLIAATPPSADVLVERAIDAVGGRAALAAQRTVSVQATTHEDAEQLFFMDIASDGVRVEHFVEHKRRRTTTLVRGRAGKLAWDFKRGAIPPDRLAFAERVWLPARLLLDEAKVERVVGAPKGQARLLLTYQDGEMLYLDVHEDTGRVSRLEGFDHAGGEARTVVVRYRGWKRYGDHWLPRKISLKRRGKKTETRVIKAARFNAPMTPHFFIAPKRGVDL
jgi:hypothetical protein